MGLCGAGGDCADPSPPLPRDPPHLRLSPFPHPRPSLLPQTERDYFINDEAALRGFIVLYPTGYGAPRGTWNAGACCGPSMTLGIDEVGFLLAVLDAAEAALCTDRSRVYATGMSNGGLMALRLACEASDRIAAVAPVAASLEFFPCTPPRAVGVMMIHGTGDRNIYWEGGPGCGVSGTNFTSIPVSIDTACAFNGCGCVYADRAQCGTPYYAYGDGECVQHGGAPANASTVLCAIHGGGHKWPQPRDPGEPVPTPPADPDECDKTVGDFPANAAMWQFFTRHTRAI